MKQWEYLFINVPDEHYKEVITYLNNLGEEGWEFTNYTEDTGYATRFLMKRSKGG